MAKRVPIEEILKILKKVKTYDWLWICNPKCKYINLRIDMRDGHCLLFDREDNPIELKDLQYQYKVKGSK